MLGGCTDVCFRDSLCSGRLRNMASSWDKILANMAMADCKSSGYPDDLKGFQH